jgi:methionyl-tRNA formyltransferase
MRIFVLTQEDAFYIPIMLDHLFAERRDIAGVGIVPGEMRPGHVRRYFEMLGPRDFGVTAANLAAHRALDAVSRLLPTGRSFSIAGAAHRHRVPSERVPKVNAPAFIDALRRRGVDLLVSIACPQILKPELLSVPAHGCINIHGSLLPRYQGILPSFWVLAKGERETGVTVHYIDAAIDHGEVILQRRVPIRDDDTVHSLVKRSKIELGKHLLVEAIARIERGDAPRTPMDHAQSTYFSYPDRAAVAEFRARGRRFI